MLKVLIIHNSGATNLPSGELKVAQNEMQSLNNVGIKCKLHIISNDNIGNVLSLKSLMTGINLFWSYPSLRKIGNLINDYKPDIVHFHGVLPLLTPSVFYACRRKNIPVVQTLHNFRWACVEGGLFRKDFYCEVCIKSSGLQGFFYGCAKSSRLISLLLFLNNLFYRKSGILFSLVDKFIAVSEFVKNKHIEAGFPAEKIIIKYNSIPLILTTYSSSNISDRIGITYVGRLAPAKGTSIIKKVAKEINIPFNIVGTGPDLETLKVYCQLNNLYHVRFWDQLQYEDVLKIISNSQCVIIPSLCGETFSLVAAETMALGIPVVAFKLGGVAELIEKSGGGITVTPANIEEFLKSIQTVLHFPERAQEMGRLGKGFVEKYLTGDLSAKKLVEIYTMVINANKKVA